LSECQRWVHRLELGHGAENRKCEFADRRARIDGFAITDKLDSEGPEGFQRPEQVADGSGEAVEAPNAAQIESPALGILHEPVQFWPGVFDPVM
jgi:hypothetical protein